MIVLMLIFSAGCAGFDLVSGKIPNRWVSGFLAAAAAVSFAGASAAGGTLCGLQAVAGWYGRAFLCLLILYPLFYLRMMGAGDVKMLAVLCAGPGFQTGVPAAFCGLCAAALWSAVYMGRRGLFKKRMAWFFSYFNRLAAGEGRFAYYDAARDGREAGFHLAPFVCAGYCLFLAALGC